MLGGLLLVKAAREAIVNETRRTISIRPSQLIDVIALTIPTDSVPNCLLITFPNI